MQTSGIHKAKVGIITIHDIYNYGSVLQAYATVRAIEKLGFSAELIDYKYPNRRHAGGVPSARRRLVTKVNAFLKDVLPGEPYSAFVRNYEEFRREHLNISEKSYGTEEEIIQNPPNYDVYLAGSDQIWRPDRMKADPVFFLAFGDLSKRRVSYASSFGCTSISEDYRSIYSTSLNRFDRLSVRESSGVKLIEDLTGRIADLVLDPTLLLTGKEWDGLAETVPFKRPYVVCYGFNPDSRYMEDVALSYAKQHDLDVIRINGSFLDYFSRGVRYILHAGPAQWIALLRDAQFVFAQSFHATVFSILFRRPFYSVLRGNEHHDSRQKNLLELTGLSEHQLTVGDNYQNSFIHPPAPNFELAQSKIDVLREHSLSFLLSSLSIQS